jgi:hypothetical protein
MKDADGSSHRHKTVVGRKLPFDATHRTFAAIP